MMKSYLMRRSQPLSAVFYLLICLLLMSSTIFAQSQSIDYGYRDHQYGSGVINTPTAEKPESKLWWQGGFWWGTMWDPGAQAYHIYRFSAGSQSWENTGTAIDNRDESLGDALSDGSKLYIASHIFSEEGKSTSSGNAGRMYRFSYNSGSKSYSLDSGYPVNINGARSESLVIEKDNTGKLWAAWIESKKVKINCTDGSDDNWGSPFNLPVQGGNTSSDDVCSIISLNGKIGVLWSNQDADAAYFAVHNDGDSKTDWQSRETALSGQNNIIDDHINIGACDTEGNLYATVKTGLSSSSAPKIYVLKRTSSGNWSQHVAGTESDGHTRPIVLVDTDNDQVYMIAKGKDGGDDGIYMKRANMSDMVFPGGIGDPLILDNSYDNINNPSSTKQCINNTTGLLVLASDKSAKSYFHNYIQPLAEGSNQAPVIAAIPDQQMDANSTLTVDISVHDPDNDDIEISVDDLPGFAAFNEQGSGSASITFTPDAGDAGEYFIEILAGDDGDPPLERSETFRLSVINANHAPQITEISNAVMQEGETLEISFSATDEDGDPVSLTAGNLPGFATFTDNENGSGAILFQPDYSDAGEFSGISITATDDGNPALNVTAEFQLTVQNVNRAPSLAAVSDQALNEGETLSLTISGTDPDNDDLTVKITHLPDFGQFNESETGGTLTFQPQFSDAGVFENIEIILSDDGDPALGDTASLTLIVNNINQKPVISGIEDISIDAESIETVTISAADPDGDGIILRAAALADFMNFADNGNGSGSVRLSPAAADYGNFTIEIIADDSGTPMLSDTVSFNLTVESINHAPVISAVSDVEILENDSLQILISAEDSDGHAITLSAENMPLFVAFSDLGNGNGEFFIKPGISNEGKYENITVTATDNGLPAMASSVTFNLQVGNTNQAPFANDDQIVIDEDNAITLNTLGNDRDLNGDALSIAALITDQTLGQVEADSGDSTVTYTPPENYSGSDVFSYVVTDGKGGADTAAVSITILPLNDVPQFSNLPDSVLLSFDESATIDLWLAISDVESPDAALDIRIEAFPDTLNIHYEDDSGLLTITPKNAFSQVEVSLRITATDPDGAAGIYTIPVVVNSIPLGIDDPLSSIPTDIELQQNYPNPFNPSTEIRFGIPRTAAVTVDVLDVLGKPVAVLLNDVKSAGYHQVTFQAGQLPSGIYLYRIQIRETASNSRSFQLIKRMILMK